MAMSFSRSDAASPAQVADATFSTGRRGFDQDEVRDFLRMLSAELGRLRDRESFLEQELMTARSAPAVDASQLDDEALTRLLGEETVRVLNAARESANEIREKAEQSAARLLTEASDEASRRREEAEIEASRRRADATKDAEAELSMAKQQGREMVNEARAYRERVLSELARRRELAREQIEQLVHGRDRLIQAFERARVAAVDVVAEIQPLGEPNEYVNLQPTTGPVPVMVARDATPRDADQEIDGAASSSDASAADEVAPVVTETEQPTDVPVAAEVDRASGSDMTNVVELAEVMSLSRVTEISDAADSSDADGADADDVAELAVVEEIADAGGVDDVREADTESEGEADTGKVDTEDAEGAVEADGSDLDATDADAAAVSDTESLESDPDDNIDDDVVVDLFARLRGAAFEADEAHVIEDADPDDVDVPDTTDVAAVASIEAVESDGDFEADPEIAQTGEAAPFEQRDADLTPLIVASAKKIKRVLADEQNEVLDGLRRSDQVVSLDTILPRASEHSARYRDGLADDLLLAANAGAQIASPAKTAKLKKVQAKEAVEHAGKMVDDWLVGPLRDRLERCVSDGDGDNSVITKKVRAVYREWKTQHIDETLDDVVRSAHGRGVLAAIEPGSPTIWTPDPRHAACPDCDDNALEGAVAAGRPFPTGHTFAPAHPGCRCMLLPAAP